MTQVSTKKDVEEAESVNTLSSRNGVWSETYFQPPRLSSDVLGTWNLGWVIFLLNLLVWAPGFCSQVTYKKLLYAVTPNESIDFLVIEFYIFELLEDKLWSMMLWVIVDA